jgi:hypothetical protein
MRTIKGIYRKGVFADTQKIVKVED